VPAETFPVARDAERMGVYAVEPLKAWRAFRLLLRDKEDTVQVFKIVKALSGRSLQQSYFRLLQTPEGGRQAYLAREFSELLSDQRWLSSFSFGTVGASYRAFMSARSLSAYSLIEATRRVEHSDVDAAHPLAWLARRRRDVHDVWHVLTGYDMDAIGEICLIAFTYGQTGNPAFAALATAATINLKRQFPGAPCFAAVYEAYRSGRAAAWLEALDYEALFSESLETARAHLGITRPALYERLKSATLLGAGSPSTPVAT